MKKAMAVFVFLVILSCLNQQKKIEKDEHNNEYEKYLDSLDYKYLNCKNIYFRTLFGCRDSINNCFQIELTSPFIPKIIIPLNLDEKNNLSYIKFHKFNKIPFDTILSYPFFVDYYAKNDFNDSLFCIFEIVNTKHNTSLPTEVKLFFIEYIWELPNLEGQNSSGVLDPTVWCVKGRRNGQSLKWERYMGKDSLYYENIQKVLDSYEIKEYVKPYNDY